MSVLLSKDTTVLIQGMTGKEGQRALKWMQASGTKVAAGVTPGKGGQEVEGVPVYNTVVEALEKHPQINTASLYVPPKFVLGAATESLEAEIPLIHIFAEGVPTKDTAILLEKAKTHTSRIVGPSSIGLTAPGKTKVGSIGGGKTDQFLPATKKKPGVALLSKSGGMSNEIASLLTEAGIPQSLVVGIGGDRFIGTTYADLLPLLNDDPETNAVVIIGEIGGSFEEQFAEAVTQTKTTKKIVAFISGIFAETLPQGVSFGHAGAIVSKTEGTRQGKITALKEAGALIAESPEQIINLLQ